MALIVNGRMIPDEVIEGEFQVIKAAYERMGRVSCCERDPEFRGYARDNVIGRVLLVQEAERRGVEVPEEEVRAEVDRLMEEHGGRAAFLAHAGLSEAEEPLVREDVAARMRVDRLLASLWEGWPGPSEEEVRAWYDGHPEDYLTPEEVRASHLFKQVRKVEERGEVYDALREIRRQALAGADFDVLAREHTDKADKLVDLGYFRRGEFMEEFDVIVFSLEKGEVSPVFASQWGFHLAKVTDRRAPVPKPFEEVREQVRERVIAEYRMARTRDFVAALQETAVIDDGESVEEAAVATVDTGAGATSG